MINHPFPPLFDEKSEILILGSFPSVKSREQAFFYGHPQNRFWKVLAAVFNEEAPQSIQEKTVLLHRHHIALWDVIAACDIIGSSDSSIKNIAPNDLSPILKGAPIRRIFTNGKMAHQAYCRWQEPILGIKATCLPSTSPANAAWDLERLTEEWKAIIQ